MKFYITVCLVLIFSLSFADLTKQSMQPLNILEGWGDFEIDSNHRGLGDSWETWRQPSAIDVSLDRSIYSTGFASQKITLLPTDIAISMNIFHNERINQESPLKAGQKLDVSFTLKTTKDISGSGIRVFLEFFRGNNQTIEKDILSEGPIQSSINWLNYSGSAVIPAYTQLVRINFRFNEKSSNTTKNIWLDNVRMISDEKAPFPQAMTIKHYNIYNYNLGKHPLKMMGKFSGARVDPDWPLLGMKRLRNDSLLTINSRISFTSMKQQKPELGNVFTWSEIQRDHPEWVLRKPNGDILTDNEFVFVDLGNPSYQQLWLQRTLEFLKDQPSKWLFFDGFDVAPAGSDMRIVTNQYPNASDFQQAETSFILAVMPVMHKAGYHVVLNMAHVPWYSTLGKSWIKRVDGGVFEYGFTNNETSGAYSDKWETWKGKFLSIADIKGKVAIMGIRAALDDAPTRRFGLASFLACMTDQSYLFYCTSVDHQVWHSDLEVPLGQPLGKYKVETGDMNKGGLISRKFEHGLVLVNPSDADSFTFKLKNTYWDLDGKMFLGAITLQPKQGFILLNKNNSLNPYSNK